MSGRLANRTALVTGAASGIGAACVERFEAEGARVAGLDVVEQASTEIFHRVDVREEDAVRGAIAEVESELGGIDILVNAAGVSGAGAVDDLEESEWDRVLDINLKGTYLTSKHVLPGMRARKRGSIVNLASIEGLVGFEMQAAYNASKGGVVLLTRNMAVDAAPDGVRVNCLCPGLIDTPMTAILKEPGLEAMHEKFLGLHLLRRAGRPEEIASAALFLASEDASFVTGHSLVVDGGFTAGHRLTDPL